VKGEKDDSTKTTKAKISSHPTLGRQALQSCTQCKNNNSKRSRLCEGCNKRVYVLEKRRIDSAATAHRGGSRATRTANVG